MIRELQDLSQNELAGLTDISQPNISTLEDNMAHLRREIALIFIKVLHVRPSLLLFPGFDRR